MRSTNRSTRTALAAFSITAVAVLGLAGCSMGGSAAESDESAMSSEESQASEEPMAADPAADLVGPGCAAYADAVPEGPGSVVGMSTDPVAVAASNNPLLTTRERDVLRLVAGGLGERDVAHGHGISPHTAHRHLSNIRLKLGVATQAAAVARALRDKLL